MGYNPDTTGGAPPLKPPLTRPWHCLYIFPETSAGLVRAQEVHTVHSKAASRLEHLQQERTWNVIKLEHWEEAAKQAAHSHGGAPTTTTTAINPTAAADASGSNASDSNLNNHQEQQQYASLEQDVTSAAVLDGSCPGFGRQAGALGQQPPAVLQGHKPGRQGSVRHQLAPEGAPVCGWPAT